MTSLALRGLYLGAVAAYAGVVLIVFLSLPERVPLHWGLSSAADSYGSRSTYGLVLVAVGLLVAAVVALSVQLARRGATTWMNLPHREWWTATPEREQTMRARLVADLYGFGTATFLLLVCVAMLTGRAARRGTDLGAGMWVVVGLYVVVVVGGAVVAARVRYRPTTVG